ncbi:hypothetical protein Q5H92_21845 [Hymenobacter sp. M29]|uniref:Lipoprotein n=1 Tax=Hymenobacter mellowenesis TaxID=3063995 RepID=A0ABT9AGM5_9BACT|nr:hypothetical protein [Hymenobacter sp. M29]MDO7849023.1 hypothetical protein [Hymenobacter sp. M29]
MKKILLFSALLAAAGCGSAPTETAATTATNPISQEEADRAAIQAYMKQTLDDPASYQPVSLEAEGSFTRADSIRVRLAMGADTRGASIGSADSTTTIGREYEHKYRAKNKLGGLVLQREYAVVFDNGKVLTYRL